MPSEILIPVVAKAAPSLLASSALVPFAVATSAAVLSVISTTPGIFPSAASSTTSAATTSLASKVVTHGAGLAGNTALTLLSFVPEKFRWLSLGLGMGALVVWLKNGRGINVYNQAPQPAPPAIHIHLNGIDPRQKKNTTE